MTAVDSRAGHGFPAGFRLVYIDFDTLERTPKITAEWLRAAARRNAAG